MSKTEVDLSKLTLFELAQRAARALYTNEAINLSKCRAASKARGVNQQSFFWKTVHEALLLAHRDNSDELRRLEAEWCARELRGEFDAMEVANTTHEKRWGRK